MKLKKWNSILLLIVVIMLTNGITVQAKSLKTMKVKNVSNNKLTMYEEEQKPLQMVFYPEDIPVKEGRVSFKSSNKKVATVDSFGCIYAEKAGTCTIWVESKVDKSIKIAINLTVKKPTVSLKVKQKEITLYTRESKNIDITCKVKGSSNEHLEITSSKTSVVDISRTMDANTGRIYECELIGLKAGKATITVKSKLDPSKVQKVKVTVKTRKPALTLSKSMMTMTEGKVANFPKYTQKGIYGWAEFSSSNKKVLLVDPDTGKLIARQKGKSKVTIKVRDTKNPSKTYKQVLTVNVKESKKKVTIQGAVAEQEARRGAVISLKNSTSTKKKVNTIYYAVTTKNKKNAGVTFSSDNKRVATVTSNGKITCHRIGEANITIRSVYDKSVTFKIKLTVGYQGDDVYDYGSGFEDPDWWDVYPGAVSLPGVRIWMYNRWNEQFLVDLNLIKDFTYTFKEVASKEELTRIHEENELRYYVEKSPRAKKMELTNAITVVPYWGDYILTNNRLWIYGTSNAAVGFESEVVNIQYPHLSFRPVVPKV